MSQEIEIKVKVERFEPIRRRLRRAGAEFLATVEQIDRFFDTATGLLRDGDRGMRLRHVRCLRAGACKPSSRPLLTYKGPRSLVRGAKRRLELQTRVDDGEAAVAILEAFGMSQTVVIQKRRASYRLDHCLVELDALPRIGRFVEVEGPGAEAIHAVRDRLSLQGELIEDSYLHLLEASCRERGEDFVSAVFGD